MRETRPALGDRGRIDAARGRRTATAFSIATAAPVWTHAGTGTVSLVSSEITGNIVLKETDAQGTDIVRRLDGAGQVLESPLLAAGLEHVSHGDWISASQSQVYQVVGPKVSPSDRGWHTPMMKRFYQAAPDFWVPDASTAEPQQTVIRNAVTRLRDALDAEPAPRRCGTWLAPAGNAAGILSSQLTNQTYGSHGQVLSMVVPPYFPVMLLPLQAPLVPVAVGRSLESDLIAAFFGTRNPDGTWNGVEAVMLPLVNLNGAFFNLTIPGDPTSTYSDGPYAGGTFRAQVRILLHEFAHALQSAIPGTAAGFQPDLANKFAQEGNNNLVNKHCGALIRGTAAQ